ncbi:MAG: ECF transporter S component [Bacilli bacterium]|nr:ECF transporter S component [Bacilli bacterium]
MRNSKTVLLTFASLIIAIVLLMALVPQLGYIQIGIVAITIIHIPVLIGALSFKNYKLAFVSGCAFGLSSWFVAMTRPSLPTDFIFQNPLVSVLPRIIFALIGLYLFILFSKLFKNKELLAAGLSAIVATLCHTIMVVGMMYLFGQSLFPNGFINIIVGIITVNGWIEIVLAGIIVPPVVMSMHRVFKHVQID